MQVIFILPHPILVSQRAATLGGRDGEKIHASVLQSVTVPGRQLQPDEVMPASHQASGIGERSRAAPPGWLGDARRAR